MLKRLNPLIPLLCLLLLALTACTTAAPGEPEPSAPPAAPTEASLKLDPGQYPVVDGSTLTIPFSEAVGAAVMHLPIEEARTYIKHNTTHNAYVNLIAGTADIIFVTPPSEGELELAKQKGVELEVIPMLRDGFVFFVNEQNPVSDLKLSQIIDIYSGKILNWKDVGGPDQEILAYQRPVDSGSQTGMLKLVMKDVPLMPAPQEKVFAAMGEIIDAVARYDNKASAIGYSYYYYVKNMWVNEKIKLISVDGVEPSDQSIGAGDYPLTMETVIVLRKDTPTDSSARQLADWVLSNEGQAVAREAGYVPLSK